MTPGVKNWLSASRMQGTIVADEVKQRIILISQPVPALAPAAGRPKTMMVEGQSKTQKEGVEFEGEKGKIRNVGRMLKNIEGPKGSR